MKRLQAFAICILTMGSVALHADEARLEPARMQNAAEIAQLTTFPEAAREGEIVIIRCGTTVSARGRIDPGVYSNPAEAATFGPFETEVRKVFARLRFEPARVDHRRVDVWLNFSFVFDNMHGTKQIRIVPNLQYDTNRYGDDYLDSQRIDTWGFPRQCSARTPLWTMSKIDANGKATSTSVILGKTWKSCESALIRLLTRSTYIPAQHDGKTVEGTYIEAWYSSQ